MVVVSTVLTVRRYLRLSGHPLLDNGAKDSPGLSYSMFWTFVCIQYVPYLVLFHMNCLRAPMLEDSHSTEGASRELRTARVLESSRSRPATTVTDRSPLSPWHVLLTLHDSSRLRSGFIFSVPCSSPVSRSCPDPAARCQNAQPACCSMPSTFARAADFT